MTTYETARRTTTTKAAPPGRLRVGVINSISSADIRQANDGVSSLILSEVYQTPYEPPTTIPEGDPLSKHPPKPLLFAGPLRRDADSGGKPVFSADIRKEILFSDGTSLNAEIVARSLMHSPDFTSKATARADHDRVVFNLKEPISNFAHFLTLTFCAVVLEKNGTLYGTGPFVLPKSFKPNELGSTVVLPRNPHYRGTVNIEEIACVDYASTSALFEAVKLGDVDITHALTSIEAGNLRGAPVRPTVHQSNATGVLHFVVPRPGMQDPRVRKAISYAIDKVKIAEITHGPRGLAYVASGLLPPFLGKDRFALTWNQREALDLLASCGTPRPLTLLETYAPRPYLPHPKETCLLIQKQLSEVGIKVTIVTPKSREEFLRIARAKEVDMVLAGWIADTFDPSDFFEAYLLSDMIPTQTIMTATSNNFSHWSHPPMDAALATYRADDSVANREAIMRILAEEAPLVPLLYGKAVTILSTRVKGFIPSPLVRSSLASLDLSP
jgi:ABC-type transport system substrate-binding protein